MIVYTYTKGGKDAMKFQIADSAPKPIGRKHPSLVTLIQKSELPIMKGCMLLAGLSLILFTVGMYVRHFKPKPRYYEVINSTEGVAHVKPMTALSLPNLSTQTVLKWATEAATAAYRLNFYDYAGSIKNMRPYFTESGYRNFIADFSKRVLPDLIQKKLVLSSVVTDTPILLREGRIVGDLYAWEIQFPMLLTYESQSDKIYQKVIVTLFIIQVPTTESPQGIGIVSFITRENS